MFWSNCTTTPLQPYFVRLGAGARLESHKKASIVNRQLNGKPATNGTISTVVSFSNQGANNHVLVRQKT